MSFVHDLVTVTVPARYLAISMIFVIVCLFAPCSVVFVPRQGFHFIGTKIRLFLASVNLTEREGGLSRTAHICVTLGVGSSGRVHLAVGGDERISIPT